MLGGNRAPGADEPQPRNSPRKKYEGEEALDCRLGTVIRRRGPESTPSSSEQLKIAALVATCSAA